MNIKSIVVLLVIGYSGQFSRAHDVVEIEMNPDKVENRINEKVYGFLLEHIYHSVDNGLWGENVWNRSFEELLAYGDWKINDKGEVLLDAGNREMADFRICRGRDYEINMDIKRLGGNGPVLVGVRDQNRERMLTNRIYCYLGAEQNACHKVETSTGWIWHTPVAKTEVAAHTPGRLEVGKWVHLRMRCIGNHLSLWLDGVSVADCKIEGCPKDGAITLGGKDCQVLFRNVQVTSLTEEQIDVNLNPVRHWRFLGNGSVTTTRIDVLNDKTALHIKSEGKFAGIEQPENFSIRQDDLQKGSLFLKGNVGEVFVQILKGEKVLAEQRIKGITEVWNEFPVELLSRKSTSEGTLRICVKEAGDLYIDQVSLMHHSSLENGGFRVDLTEAAAALKPTAIRWPGGSFSEQYRFENGIGKQSGRKGILKWDDFDPLSFGTDEFVAFCRKVGAEPVIVVPIGYHNYAGYAPDKDGKQDWLQRALDWMEYCNGDAETTYWGKLRAANGHPEPYDVKYWEIDNEAWKMSPKLYAEITRLFSIAMKKKDPDIKIIGCGCGRLGREGAGLDSIMIHDVGEYIDYISPHYYQTLNKYGTDGVEEYGRYLDQLARWIEESGNPDMGIYLSEWNLEGIDMRTGLFAGGFLNRLERTPKLEMAAPALYLRHVSAPGWNNAFINFDHGGWFPAPNYVVLKLWREHFLPNRVELSGDCKMLNMVATVSDNREQSCLKMVNPTENAVTVKLKKTIQCETVRWNVVRASALKEKNTMEKPDCIRVEEMSVKEKDGYIWMDIPPYSASVLSMEK